MNLLRPHPGFLADAGQAPRRPSGGRARAASIYSGQTQQWKEQTPATGMPV
jgi:hypothetical protein